MPYIVQFVGLTYFQRLTPEFEGDGRRALLPDGRFPAPDIQPHLATISVRSEDIRSVDGWYDREITFDKQETEFSFPPSTITFQGADVPGAFDGKDLGPRIPQLQKIDPNFRVDANANWIANILIRQGKIEALRLPGLPDDGSAQLLAELIVPHDDEITITVTPKKGWPVRTIVLNPGSEIAIINTSRGLAPRAQNGNHFQIYAELSCVPVHLVAPATTPVQVPGSMSRHPSFRRASPATGSTDCVPTCC
jgi:hypothetical protein